MAWDLESVLPETKSRWSSWFLVWVSSQKWQGQIVLVPKGDNRPRNYLYLFVITRLVCFLLKNDILRFLGKFHTTVSFCFVLFCFANEKDFMSQQVPHATNQSVWKPTLTVYAMWNTRIKSKIFKYVTHLFIALSIP